MPFSLRLLHAQLPAHQNFPQLTLDRLCHIQSICEQVLAEVNHGRLPNQPHPLTSHDQQGRRCGHCHCTCINNILYLSVAVRLWKKRTARVKCAMANTFVAIQVRGRGDGGRGKKGVREREREGYGEKIKGVE